MNNVTLIGRFTDKPELNYTTSQMAVTKFTIAVDRIKEGADFIRCTAFGRRAEAICRYKDKGDQIAIRGHIQTGSYKNKDGKTVYTTEVIVDDDEFIGGRSEKVTESVDMEQVEREVNDLLGTNFSYTSDGMPF